MDLPRIQTGRLEETSRFQVEHYILYRRGELDAGTTSDYVFHSICYRSVLSCEGNIDVALASTFQALFLQDLNSINFPVSPDMAELRAHSCSTAWCEGPDGQGRTILFSACDSPESLAAFAWSRANLLRKKDVVVLVHVYKDRVFGSSHWERAVEVLGKFEALCKEKEVQFRVVLSQGSAAKVIVGAAHANQCDLCIMGCRGLGALRRAVVGSVSSQVAAACPCPVLVIKMPRNDVGAFLTVVPRRVFIRIDGTPQSTDAFRWASNNLLSSEIDEVFLLLCSEFGAHGGGWFGGRGTPRKETWIAEAERLAIERIADACLDQCIRQGLNVSKVRVKDSASLHEWIAEAELNSCDVLVVGKEPGTHREDVSLHAAHIAPMPVIVVGDTWPSPKSALLGPEDTPCESTTPSLCSVSPALHSSEAACRRSREKRRAPPVRVSVKTERQKETQAKSSPKSVTAVALSSFGSLKLQAKSSDDKLSTAVTQPTLGDMPRSSSLERLLDALADKEEACVMRSRRDYSADEPTHSGDMHVARQGGLHTCFEQPLFEHASQQPTPQSPPGSEGVGMRRIATRAVIGAAVDKACESPSRQTASARSPRKGCVGESEARQAPAAPSACHTQHTQRKYDERAEHKASPGVSASNGGNGSGSGSRSQDMQPRLDLGEPWIPTHAQRCLLRPV